MKRIAVLMTVFNRKSKTLRCLDSLFSQPLPSDVKLTVYLTDDGCTDGTPEAIKSKYPNVHIINGDGNLFWNRGMYKAWTEAEKEDYDYYLWLNDDTYLSDNAINELISGSLRKNDQSIIVGHTLDENKQFITYGPTDIHGRLIKKFKLGINDDNMFDCPSFNGNIVLIPKFVYKIVGKNDPYYRHSLGDIDYGLRVREKGLKSYTLQTESGLCNRHETIPKWRDSNINIKERFKYLYQPGGNGHNPIEHARFKKCHFGILAGIGVYLSLHIQTLFPKQWRKIIDNIRKVD